METYNQSQLTEKLMELDLSVSLSELSDEKLKELGIEVFKQAFKRSETMALEFATIIEKVKDEFDRAEIRDAERKVEEEERKRKAKEEAQKLQDAQGKLWQKKKEQSQKLVDCLGYEKLYVTVWSKDAAGDVDRRVYVKTGDYYGGSDVATYWLHGNDKVLPKNIGTNNNRNISNNYDKEELKAILHKIATSWKGVKFETAQAINYQA